jgi:hypothetical protein
MTSRSLTVSGVLPPDFVDLGAKNGPPVPSMINARIALEKFGLDCRYNIFQDRYTVQGFEFGNSAVQVSDEVTLKLRELTRIAFQFDPGAQNMYDAVMRACHAGRYHPVLDFLDDAQQRWDGIARIDTMLPVYFGAENTPFNRALSRLVMIASVRRIREPGCKYDYMIVMHSEEGYGKSPALAMLYGEENFSDQTIIGSDKELQEKFRGKWGIEWPELEGMHKGELEQIKATITRQVDRARPAYGRSVIEVPRSVILWGSTNDDQWLRAHTGVNRRFLPLDVGRIDLAALERDRAQLWGEASYENAEWRESLSLPPKFWSVARKARDGFTQADPWADVLHDVGDQAARAQKKSPGVPTYCVATDKDGNPEERVSSDHVHDVLGIFVEKRNAAIAKRISLCMQSKGWAKPAMHRIGGRPVRGYARPWVLG